MVWLAFHRVMIFPWEGKQDGDKGSKPAPATTTTSPPPRTRACLPPTNLFVPVPTRQPNTNTTVPFLSSAKKHQLWQAKRPHQHPPFALYRPGPTGGTEPDGHTCLPLLHVCIRSSNHQICMWCRVTIVHAPQDRYRQQRPTTRSLSLYSH